MRYVQGTGMVFTAIITPNTYHYCCSFAVTAALYLMLLLLLLVLMLLLCIADLLLKSDFLQNVMSYEIVIQKRLYSATYW